ncbi:MAG: bifunctional aspartate kinase/homoserine dehydrogenase I [Candidatus Marinimicrobia bacterium]|nr:bifunctional aspartate kinase/homoserine dehydrogenase I [Candidatus Neomarinimicrobiota bacterium]
MKVIKFGGTSLGSPELVQKVSQIVSNIQQEKPGLVVVFSAFSGVTNLLIEAGQKAENGDSSYLQTIHKIITRHLSYIHELFTDTEINQTMTQKLQPLFHQIEEITHGMFLLKEMSPKSLDLLQSFGEQLSCAIIAEYFNYTGINNQLLDTRNLFITDEKYNNARIKFDLTSQRIKNAVSDSKAVYVSTGFIASTEKGTTTTIGRSGSDLTAAIYGAALKAESVEIWTDVTGVMSADPRKVRDAFSLKSISYIEAMEMSHFGAKVIHPLTVQPLMDNDIPCIIKNTFSPDEPGTMITNRPQDPCLAKGVTSIDNIALITLQGSGMIGIEGTASRMFAALARGKINVILISQASSEHSICAAIKPESAETAREYLEEEFAAEIAGKFIERVKIEHNLSIIAIVGEQMQHTPGISGKLFDALAQKNINVVAIAQGSSELNISVVIRKSDEKMALNAVHESFFALQSKIFLFIAGVGLISSELLKQIKDNHRRLLDNKKLNLIVAGLCNSQKMILDSDGIDLNNYREILQSSDLGSDVNRYLEFIHQEKLTHCIFVDCTANEAVSQSYCKFLSAGVSVVAANKQANTRKYEEYQQLQSLSRKNDVQYLYETNAGAGLPIISTIKDLMDSGDKIQKIEAILSGTISYIFNHFTGKKPFSEIVREARELGYTEPDPRDDLNGMDFARKLLLLSREIGQPLEMEDIQLEQIVPDQCMQVNSVEEFFSRLQDYDDYFQEKQKSAAEEGKKLSWIAKYEAKLASITLQSMDKSHPFYSLQGSDNIIALTTDRYPVPLVIKGAGAGAGVTAAGVFADIFKIANTVIMKRNY